MTHEFEQDVLSLCQCIYVYPLALVVGFFKRGGRAIWDAFMFHAVIKKRGRVPAQDGFIARRTAGPGLASNYFYQVCKLPLTSNAERDFLAHLA